MKQYKVITDIKMTYVNVVDAHTAAEAEAEAEKMAMNAFENGDYDMDVSSQASEFPQATLKNPFHE